MTDEIRKAREAFRAADETLYTNQNRLRTKEAEVINAKRLGKEGTQRAEVLAREIAALKEAIARNKSNLESTKGQLADLVGKFVLPLSPQQLASQLDDGLPCLLFPVRMEVRFMGFRAAGNYGCASIRTISPSTPTKKS